MTLPRAQTGLGRQTLSFAGTGHHAERQTGSGASNGRRRTCVCSCCARQHLPRREGSSLQAHTTLRCQNSGSDSRNNTGAHDAASSTSSSAMAALHRKDLPIVVNLVDRGQNVGLVAARREGIVLAQQLAVQGVDEAAADVLQPRGGRVGIHRCQHRLGNATKQSDGRPV